MTPFAGTRQETERHPNEDNLRDSERDLGELTETIPQMLWSADAGAVSITATITRLTTQVCLWHRCEAQAMRVVHPEDIDKMDQAWTAAVLTGEPFQYEFRCFCAADHAHRWCISSALPLRDQGGWILR